MALILVACGSANNDSDSATSAEPESNREATAPTLAAALASPGRSEEDRLRDAGRRPVAVIDFLGIDSGMSVIDLIAGGGYYTEVLSYAVGKNGQVTSQNPAIVLQMRDGVNEKELSDRLSDNRLPNVVRLNREIAELLASDGPYDAAFTALNLHDIYNNGGEQGAVDAFRLISAMLKPGAVFGVIDHHGGAGNDNKALHRINIGDAIRIAESAGFVVEAQSGLLHVHDDDMSQGVFAEGRRGNTHRFLLRLRKPE
jgi:predicted methyltransferase